MIILIILALFLVLQVALTTIPLVFIFHLLSAVILRKLWVLGTAFFSGIFLDIMLHNPVGGTSIFFLISLMIVFVYDRKFDIQTYPFVFAVTFLGDFLNSLLFGYQNLFVHSLFSGLIAVFFLFILIKLNRFDLSHKFSSLSYEG
ncbi:MAG: hypothetical protein A2958_02040 [Candidatus Levybacteria bacterium RIFCSPLOWO2_01_FULL_38_13]|nr:MAG: hypothetical protein A2629_02795 [Candidatus Levybacteria bacterium RIFCSPHIGHO2_01_FULL_41_15]OGH35732.1 MAG: hypothetical protein A2958_02040 [Candidatus Levybacteria bacterium RIFCSPLOWO2_01_FULL_38_13]